MGAADVKGEIERKNTKSRLCETGGDAKVPVTSTISGNDSTLGCLRGVKI